MPRWLKVLNPVSSMRTVYGPLGSAARDELAVRVAHAFARNTGAFVRGDNGGAGDDGAGIVTNESDERGRRDLSVCGGCYEENKRDQQESPLTIA